jgi:hypothetical protein
MAAINRSSMSLASSSGYFDLILGEGLCCNLIDGKPVAPWFDCFSKGRTAR